MVPGGEKGAPFISAEREVSHGAQVGNAAACWRGGTSCGWEFARVLQGGDLGRGERCAEAWRGSEETL